MSAGPLFSYDQSEVSEVYAAARSLPAHALATWRAAIATIVPPNLGPTRSILDVGCGTGRFSSMLAQIFDADVVGVDPSEKMLGQAVATIDDPRCSFLTGAVEALPVFDRSVDLVFLSMVFHHVRDWTAAHRELRRVLRPGGVVVIRTGLKEALATHLWLKFFPTAHAIDLRRMPSADEVIAQMWLGEFRLVTHRTVSHRFADDAASYLEKMRLRGLSALRMISDAEFEHGLAALELYLRTVPTDASAFTEDMDLFCFVNSM